ncbi:hypothetical protein N9Z27_02995 [Alphaproteobacteria bacterium]|nr:hypothetical protein [Alphaproteobacteria bacterium]
MKAPYILSILSVLAFMTYNPAFAAEEITDEFGERFYSQAPVGLEDYPEEPENDFLISDEAAAALNDIFPAAGEEEATIEAPAQQIQDINTTPEKPKSLREKLESIRTDKPEKANDGEL